MVFSIVAPPHLRGPCFEETRIYIYTSESFHVNMTYCGSVILQKIFKWTHPIFVSISTVKRTWPFIWTRWLTKSERAPPKFLKLALFLLSHQKFQSSRAFKECVLHLFSIKNRVFEKRVKDQWVKVMVSNEIYCQKENTYETWKP
jgi:hypothetical protein